MNNNERFKAIERVIESKRFLEGHRNQSESSFYIVPYKAEDENDIAQQIELLSRRLNSNGVNVLVMDLYNLSLESMENQGALDYLLSAEKTLGRKNFTNAVESSLELKNIFLPKLNQFIKQDQYDVVFIKGVGKVYPFIRSHNLLSNMNQNSHKIPLILFYPGSYDGQTFRLFSILKNNNYYRATLLENFSI